jgi:class 3 adenylate cyclase
MRAWTVDADDIRVADDFDEALLHRTPEIDNFLAPDRDDKFIVIGTKGFGKTLLLKAKRVLYQRDGRTVCLPVDNLLDKPIGDKIFGRETLAFFAASPLPWSKVWLAAIALAVLKHAGATAELKVGARLAGLVADAQLRGVIDHFVRLLDFTPTELQRCASDTDGHLVPRLRALKTSLSIFIDGIDEYFNKHVENGQVNPSVTGELSPDVWYYAQLGLVEVAYQLRRINHHLKVFAAIRKEAYARLPKRTAMAQQYRGSAVDIVYSPESLREIFVNNIRLVKTERMVLQGRSRTNPLEAFLGRTSVTDAVTREEEDAFEFICRHTLLRPRDLMTIGDRLVALKPDERSNEHRMKEAVHFAATEIAHEYLAEIAPYVGDLELERLFMQLPGHVLTRAELDAIADAEAEVDDAPAAHGPDGASVPSRGSERSEHGSPIGEHVFCALHRVGLLGHVQHDRVRGEWRQRFLRPGEATLETSSVLPRAAHYLLHPVLSDVIGRLNPAYLQRIDRANVVGYDRPWRDPGVVDDASETQTRCVLKADVHGFGSLMRAGRDAPVRRALEEAVLRWAPAQAITETSAGDAVLVADDDPVALAQLARHLMDDVYQAPGQPRLRIALHYGAVQTRRREPDRRALIVGGEAILCAARVEPVVEPGQIWATDEFRTQLLERPSLWRTTPVASNAGDGRFNVRKDGSPEPDLWVRLYRLEF